MQGVTPQNRHVKSVTQGFLRVHWDGKTPLVLGYSGGPDSKALLYALLECGVKPEIAHVDHGWREESRRETELVREEAALHGLTFHTTRLDLPKTEDAARQGRLEFFATLNAPVLLAHQADDLAETVLKRIFEGAHLTALKGMEAVSTVGGVTIWRPLLTVRKKELIEFLQERGLTPFMDPTNSDLAYLRSRMRMETIPFLEKSFGKEIVNNLVLLSERSVELKEYLDGKTEKLEAIHHIQKLARRENISLNRSILETLYQWSLKNEGRKELKVKSKKVIVERGAIFFEDLKS
jgi:tRNA(Ile)-lysidine synthase